MADPAGNERMPRMRASGPLDKEYPQYAQAWYKNRMNSVREWLAACQPGLLPQQPPEVLNAYLADLAQALDCCMELLFGRQAPYETKNVMPKLPSQVFNDFTEGGALCIILHEALKFRVNRGWGFDVLAEKILPLESKDKVQHVNLAKPNIPLYQKVLDQLLAKKHLSLPVVYLSPELPLEDTQRLQQIVMQRQGRTTDRESEASFFVVRGSDDDDDDDVLQMRVLEANDGLALVHWVGCPDSYNEWVPISEAAHASMQHPQVGGQHRVTAKFLRDLEVYNEWMNVQDYVPQEEHAGNTPRGEAGEMGFSMNGETVKSKRFKGVFLHKPSAKWQAVCHIPGAGKQCVGSYDKEEEAAVAYDRNALKHLGLQRAKLNFDRGDYADLIQDLRERNDANPAPKRQRTQKSKTSLPAQGFFSMEQPDLSHLPTGPFVPPPNVPVNIAASRMYSAKALAMQDVDYEHWRTEPVVLPSYAGWFRLDAVHTLEINAFPDLLGDGASAETYVGMRNAIVNTYRDQPHKRLLASDCLKHVPGGAGTIFRIHAFLAHWGIINLESEGRTRFQKAMRSTQAPEAAKAVCSITGVPLERVHYASWRYPGFHISPTAFAAGLLPAHMARHEFVKRVAREGPHDKGMDFEDWTEEETQALLKAIEQFGDEWDMVAAMVGGGKKPEQCVLHFARLPIADRYAEAAPISKTLGQLVPLMKVLRVLVDAAPLEDPSVEEAVKAASAVLQGDQSPKSSGGLAQEIFAGQAEDVPEGVRGRQEQEEDEGASVEAFRGEIVLQADSEEMQDVVAAAAPESVHSSPGKQAKARRRTRPLLIKKKQQTTSYQEERGDDCWRRESAEIGGRIFSMDQKGSVVEGKAQAHHVKSELDRLGVERRLPDDFLRNEGACRACADEAGMEKLKAALSEGLSEQGTCHAAMQLIEAGMARTVVRVCQYERLESRVTAMKKGVRVSSVEPEPAAKSDRAATEDKAFSVLTAQQNPSPSATPNGKSDVRGDSLGGDARETS